ncbi:Histone-lysine N-methyltransferase SETMAR [Eumeta japonica]|uniref:Histone-lysine N-methyltransferase SETMAR n=1 Tax=Eumeta variegata TaxID=151549 RepID=A0A4C1U792_EUMVA|nr:Histone-lysine N-methyltransferase SETMAR [Eumeta japonica]
MLTPFDKQRRLPTSKDFLELVGDNIDEICDRIVTVDETWVRQYDLESKQESMQWTKKGERPPKKFKVQKSASKLMATIFWDSEGVLLIDYLLKGTTMNGQYYANLLAQAREAVVQKRRGKLSRGVLFLQDNASVHTPRVSRQALKDTGFSEIDHPPYSPDLAPSDYFLFSNLKKELRGRRFVDDNQMMTVESHFDCDEKEYFLGGLKALYTRSAVHADASLTQVGERQMSSAAERGGRLCLFVDRSALSLALQALNGTSQSAETPHESCFCSCDDENKLLEAAKTCPNKNFQKILYVLARRERHAKLWEKFPNESIVEVKVAATDSSWQKKGLMKALVEKTEVAVRARGLRVLRMDTSSYYSALCAERLGFRCEYSAAYRDIQLDGQLILVPEPPHNDDRGQAENWWRPWEPQKSPSIPRVRFELFGVKGQKLRFFGFFSETLLLKDNTRKKNTRNKKQVQLSCLPPTSASAIQHFYRVYYQVQTWLDNELNPEDWGWRLIGNTLEPIQTLLPPAPDKLLNTIFCNCKKGCNAKCGCRRVGLLCSLACTECQGQSCSNVLLSTTEEDSCDFDGETNDSCPFEEILNIQQEEEEEEKEEEEEEEEEIEDMTVEIEFGDSD